MSGILAAIGLAILGFAVGVVMQRRTNRSAVIEPVRHLDVDMDETEYAAWSMAPWTRENR